MKISTVFLAAFVLGIINYMGPAGLCPLPQNPKWVASETRFYDRGVFSGFQSFQEGKENEKAVRNLKERQAVLSKKIGEVEIACKKIKANEDYLKRRLYDIKRRVRSQEALCSSREAMEAVGASETALRNHLRALEQERSVFLGLLERLKNEQASLKVKIDLWNVKAKRTAVEEFLGSDKKSPLEGLSQEIKQRSFVHSGDRIISY